MAINLPEGWFWSTCVVADPDRHVRGFEYKFRTYKGYVCRYGDEYEAFVLRMPGRQVSTRMPPPAVVFRSKPTRDAYSDIPSRRDLYDLLVGRVDRYLHLGRELVSTLDRGEGSHAALRALRDWEQDHPYAMSRLQKRHPDRPLGWLEHQYATAALRGVGLVWPGKPSKRRKHWPEHVGAIGIKVASSPRLAHG